MVRVLVETGARIQEISDMKVENVDLETRTIFIDDSKTTPRYVFFSPETAHVFKTYLNEPEEQDIFGAIPGKVKSLNLFPQVDQCQKIVTSMFSALGLKENKDGRGPHTFRHYAATWLYYCGGMDLFDLAVLLGDKPDVIRDTYIHPSADMLKTRVAKAYGWKC